jgi:WD40 repeat protein
LLLRRDWADSPLPLGPQKDVRYCAVSTDGRWVATASHGKPHGIKAKVWDASTGECKKDLPTEDGRVLGFSPGGKWLMTLSLDCRLWAVGTWEEGPPLGKGYWFAFSPDDRVLAVMKEPGVLRLLEPATGREFVRLDAPVQTRLSPIGFSPDGSQLFALGLESQALHVWDLRLIRRQLKELGLDWDLPPYPEPPARPKGPLQVEIVKGP